MDKNASVQCKLQLLSMHTRARNSLFGIVTDGYSFKFMKLDANGIFHFEKETPIRIENRAAFYKMLGVINRLIYDGVNEVGIGATSLEIFKLSARSRSLGKHLWNKKHVREEIENLYSFSQRKDERSNEGRKKKPNETSC